MGFVVRGGRISAIDVLADPARIGRIDLSAVTMRAVQRPEEQPGNQS